MSLSPETEALFSSARDAMGRPDDGDRERNLVAVLARVGGAAGAVSLGAGVAASGKAAGGSLAPAGLASAGVTKVGSLFTVKLLLPLALTAAVGAGTVLTLQARGGTSPAPKSVATSPRTVTSPATAPAVVEAATPSGSAVPVVAIADMPTIRTEATIVPPSPRPALRQASPVRVSNVSATDAPPASVPAKDTSVRLHDEVVVVAKIHEAQRAGDNARVFALVEEHERLFPDGLLYEECRASAAMAFCAQTTGPAAKARVESFRQQYPTSPLLPRVVSACEK